MERAGSQETDIFKNPSDVVQIFEMDTRIDFMQHLESDVCMKIFERMDDPSDLIRVSAVSHLWRHFVISNQFSKKLCMRLFPQMAMEGSSDRDLKMDHMMYARLARSSKASTMIECIDEAVCASSTHNFPHESIINTLFPWDVVPWGLPCYWSSTGNENAEVPETLIYRLRGNICVITEIDIKPFKAYFQQDNPIYSPVAFRFRLGHPRLSTDMMDSRTDLPLQLSMDAQFVWTYTSPDYPVDQDNSLQKFKLTEPILCIGGFIQIELLGRVLIDPSDGLFYQCVSHVKVLGEPLSPKFNLEFVESSGRFLLSYFPENQHLPLPTSRYQVDESDISSEVNLMALGYLFDNVHGNALPLDIPFQPL